VRDTFADRSAERWDAWVADAESLTNRMLRCFEGPPQHPPTDCNWQRLERIFRVESLDTVVLASDTP
jgi:hypothetical protein